MMKPNGIKLLVESALLGVQTLWQHKFRSFLTILGVLIGVVIIQAVASVLNGFRDDVVSQVEEFGTNNIYVSRFPFVNIGHRRSEVRNRKPLTLDDAWAIRDHCPSVRSVTPYLSRGGILNAKYRDNLMETPELRGSTTSALETSSAELVEGRNFTRSENEHRARVAIIGHSVKEALFPAITAEGKSMSVAGASFRVIGVMGKRKEGPFGSENPEDRQILIPYLTFRKMYPRNDDHFISALAFKGARSLALDEITEILRIRRKVPIDEENNFELGTADSIIETFDKIVAGTLAVMFMLSTVAFLVGGVGVMNIMLVSVTERTREIGIRKAIGARRRDIVTQFLTEAAVLTGIGGLLGMTLAEGLLRLIDAAVDQIHAVTPLWARIFGLGGSMAIGIVFGLWPAIKASRLDPIEALRYE